MSFEEELKEKKKQSKIKTEWTDSEMEEFDKDIELYRVEVIGGFNNTLFKYFSVGSELKYLEDKGIIKVQWLKPWQEVKNATDSIFSIIDKDIYEDFENKLRFYFNWQEKQKLGNLGL